MQKEWKKIHHQSYEQEMLKYSGGNFGLLQCAVLNELLKLCITLSYFAFYVFNPLNPELNPICYLLALLGAHHFLHVSRIRVKSLTLR